MNKHRTNALLQLLVLFALAAAVVLTLAWPQLPFARRESEPVEVSVILRQADAALWANARLGMEQAAGQLRAELRIVAPTADNDPAEQARLMRYEAERGADVLVVVPAGELPADVGVPVITLESAGGAGAVCPDNEALGRALAEAALADAPAGSVLLVDTAPGAAGVSARLAAAKAALEEAGVDPAADTVAVVTNDFHMARSELIAARQGYGDVAGVPAPLPWAHLTVNYYLREAFALVKTFLFD